jgi:hypothetical protein
LILEVDLDRSGQRADSECMRLAVPCAVILLWGLSAISLYGPALAMIWLGGLGLWLWLVLPLPFAALILAEACGGGEPSLTAR